VKKAYETPKVTSYDESKFDPKCPQNLHNKARSKFANGRNTVCPPCVPPS